MSLCMSKDKSSCRTFTDTYQLPHFNCNCKEMRESERDVFIEEESWSCWVWRTGDSGEGGGAPQWKQTLLP